MRLLKLSVAKAGVAESTEGRGRELEAEEGQPLLALKNLAPFALAYGQQLFLEMPNQVPQAGWLQKQK